MEYSFSLSEQFALSTGGSFHWRLKDQEIRFRGTGPYSELVHQRIPAHDYQIISFHDALNLLDVWSWKESYQTIDTDYQVMDGSSWSFTATFSNQTCKTSGGNAYPSYLDVNKTVLERERYGLLIAALYDCFNIETYIHIAKRQKES
jgi:hypothetical protein